jgi:hypothetical protein
MSARFSQGKQPRSPTPEVALIYETFNDIISFHLNREAFS